MKSKEPADAARGPADIIAMLRRMQPARALRVYEHQKVAERQATELLASLSQTGPAAELGWLMELDKIDVVLMPAWKMEGLSGMTTWQQDRWVVAINKGNPPARRRFTLCHEFKHVLDANRDQTTYRGLTDQQREQVADYFAACFLMPKLWLRHAWMRGLQDPEALAGLFKVSLQAMTKRLTHLGFIDTEPDRPTASYFRLAAGVAPTQAA